MSWRIPIIETLDALKAYLQNMDTSPVDFKLKIKDFYYDLPPHSDPTDLSSKERLEKIEHIHHEKNFNYDRLLERIEKLEGRINLLSDFYTEQGKNIVAILEGLEKRIERLEEWKKELGCGMHVHTANEDRLMKLEDERFENIATIHKILERIEKIEASWSREPNYIDYTGLLRRLEKLESDEWIKK